MQSCRCQLHPVIQLIERTGFRWAGLIGLIAVGIMAVGLACQVPVFRFALERWEADSYTIVIVPGKQGKLSPAEEKVRTFLQSQGSADTGTANLKVRIDFKKAGEGPRATMQLFYPPKPAGSDPLPIWTGALTMENAQLLIGSPARHEIVTRLLKGESATWVMIECGDHGKDDHAASEIKQAFVKAESALKIPDGVLTVEEARKVSQADGSNSDDVLRSRIPLQIKFSLIRVSRDDPAELILREMLLHMEDDLGEFRDEPMVFPVFGRGRALEPLIGRGINTANVFEHASYFCGACSCEIKNQNPGIDLVIAANWEAAIAGSEVIVEKSLPPLPGVGALSVGDVAEDDAPTADPGAGFSSRSPWIVAAGGVLLLLGLGSVWISRTSQR